MPIRIITGGPSAEKWVAVVAGAQRAVAGDGHELAGARSDRAEQLDVDPGLAQRGARELAQEVGAVGSGRARPAAQAQRGPQCDGDSGGRGGGQRGELRRGCADLRQVRPQPRNRHPDAA